MWEGDLEGLGGVSEVPHGQAAVRVAAHELLAFVMPAHWVDGLQAHSAKEKYMNTALKSQVKNTMTVFLSANGKNHKPFFFSEAPGSFFFLGCWCLKCGVYEWFICMKYESLLHFPPTPDSVDKIRVFLFWRVTTLCQCHILDIKACLMISFCTQSAGS